MSDQEPITHIIAKGLHTDHFEYLERILGNFANTFTGVSFEITTPTEQQAELAVEQTIQTEAPVDEPQVGSVVDPDQETGQYDSSLVTWFTRKNGTRVAVVTREQLVAEGASISKSEAHLATRSLNSVYRYSYVHPQIKQHLETDFDSNPRQPYIGIKADNADALIALLDDLQVEMRTFGAKSLDLLKNYFSKMVREPEE